MSTPWPKYSRAENERKFLVDREAARHLLTHPHWEIRDTYLACGRLRLRSIRESDSERVTYKLCKKYGPHSAWTEPIVNIYLTQDEYDGLADLPGHALVKHRYHDLFRRHTFSIDVFGDDLAGLMLCEIEAATVEELHRIVFPTYATHEVTGDRFFTGGCLCSATPEAVTAALARYGSAVAPNTRLPTT